MSWLIPVIIFFDQLTKKLAETFLIQSPIKIGIFELTYVENTGVAFGLFRGKSFIHGIVATIIAVFLCFFREKYLKANHEYNFSFDLGICFIISGALGNIFDRIRLGYVVDIISWHNFSVFNVADIFITCGGIVLLYHLVRRSLHGKNDVQSE
ncbi:MAG TPA: signal peptidase II [Defluviitoga sp.]|nr:signal peptidase II [Defluviitoga sp.]HOP25313.1 signal peptidase II [Defluviitoga sp.]HPZ29449.1 signal peptidase II [Defluviitoga sp.]HQD63276.1 signal peptidase II [Defluviitoga sp.]